MPVAKEIKVSLKGSYLGGVNAIIKYGWVASDTGVDERCHGAERGCWKTYR
jgi:hypothetical protein